MCTCVYNYVSRIRSAIVAIKRNLWVHIQGFCRFACFYCDERIHGTWYYVCTSMQTCTGQVGTSFQSVLDFSSFFTATPYLAKTKYTYTIFTNLRVVVITEARNNRITDHYHRIRSLLNLQRSLLLSTIGFYYTIDNVIFYVRRPCSVFSLKTSSFPLWNCVSSFKYDLL